MDIEYIDLVYLENKTTIFCGWMGNKPQHVCSVNKYIFLEYNILKGLEKLDVQI